MIKIHPPHQLLFPNDYLNGVKELEIIYRAAEANGIPVMFHTGTSIFPGARNNYGDPIYVDDVAVDFPKLKILLAHGGRPLWMQTAFFLVRRHPNVYLDISGIPPKTLLKYFPRLEEIAHKTLFGTDWPGPGVPDIKKNLDEFRALPLSEAVQQQILSKTALSIWPAEPSGKRKARSTAGLILYAVSLLAGFAATALVPISSSASARSIDLPKRLLNAA